MLYPRVPHQLCHFHYLHEAAKPIYEADRHAKKEPRSVSVGYAPLNGASKASVDPEAEVVRGYCAAVRSASRMMAARRWTPRGSNSPPALPRLLQSGAGRKKGGWPRS